MPAEIRTIAEPSVAATPPDAGRDVVFAAAYVSWDAMRRRGGNFAQDRLTRRLLDGEAQRVLFAEPFRHVLGPIADRVQRRQRTPFPQQEGRNRVVPLRLRREDPEDVAAAAKAFAAYDRRLERAVRRHGLRDPAVITTHPLVAGLAPLRWASTVTFYCTDDWTAYPARRPWWPAYEESFRRFASSGRRLCSVSAPLLERLAPTGPAAVVPNGLEPEEWRELPPPPPSVDALPRPRLGYVGSLDSRIDVEALAELATALPDLAIVLVGPVTEPEALAPLHALANVHVLPPVRRDGVRAILGAVDVGLIPHRETALTRCMSPLKLYEYLAAGLPVVGTDLAPMRGVDPRVHLVPADEPLAPAVLEALAAGRMADGERYDFIDANSWPSRHTRIVELAFARR